MAGFISNILWNSVEGFVEAGTRSAGEYAGNALIKVGDMVENGGRGIGNGIEKKATGYGSTISGQTYQPSPKALPSTARKPAIKRSNSTPASSKPTTGATKFAGPKPVGANKYPGANQAGRAKKAGTGSAYAAKNTASSVSKPLSGVAQSALNKPKPSYPTSATRSNSLPRPYNPGNAFPSSDKKSAVRPGQPKPFTPPVGQTKPGGAGDAGKKAYPGQGSRVPVQNQRLKPLPRMGGQVGQGQKMTHLAV